MNWLLYHFPGAKLILATSTPVTVNGDPETLNAEKNAVVIARNEQEKAVARRYKLPVDDLAALVPELRTIDPHLTLIAAGGINLQNAAAYAATGVDGLATTASFTAKPIDMSVRMKRVE